MLLHNRRRNAERQAVYEAWLGKQAPMPVKEADIQEEDLARAAHNRVRAWGKALLDATELHAEILQNSAANGDCPRCPNLELITAKISQLQEGTPRRNYSKL